MDGNTIVMKWGSETKLHCDWCKTRREDNGDSTKYSYSREGRSFSFTVNSRTTTPLKKLLFGFAIEDLARVSSLVATFLVSAVPGTPGYKRAVPSN